MKSRIFIACLSLVLTLCVSVQPSAAQDLSTLLAGRNVTPQQLATLRTMQGGRLETPKGANEQDIDRARVNTGEVTPDFAIPETTNSSIGNRNIFGHDIFRSKRLTFEPSLNMATSANYQLGPGDELIVDVYGASQATNKLKIAPDGTANVPRIGPIAVAGLTVEQAQARVRSAMGMHYKNATIKVTVGQTRSISISVMGDVVTPGTYTLSSFATVFHALYMAGGVTETGTLRDVRVARNGRIISTVDVYEYILNGRLAGNVKLQDNDVIIVGSFVNLVKLEGKVKRPMWYEMKKNESLQSLLKFAGGFTGDAYTKKVTVNRRNGDKLSVYTVDEFDYSSFAVADEDNVTVNAIEERYSNLVAINGAVKRAGQYQISAVNTVRGLIETAGGLEENAMMNRAVLVRVNPDRTHRTLSLDLEGIMNGTVADVALENEDEITIASLAQLQEEQTMTIDGEVWAPGTFRYSANTTIEDLITIAGGLKESASLMNVEVSRRIVDPLAKVDSEQRCETFTFDLSDGLNVSESNNFVLKPYDRVYVRKSPVYQQQRTVTVAGEVVFAGLYTLKDNDVRLSDVIIRAGGLKKKAAAKNARLVRLMSDAEMFRAREARKQALNATDSIDVTDISLDNTYVVAIDLEKALEEPGSKYDVLLKDNDLIEVPQMINTVKISGEVLHPNNVTYIEGKSKSYYINQAGGYTKESLRRRAYIAYANGQVSRLSKGKIEPGCEIVVPMKKQKLDDGSAMMKWISVVISSITASALVITALKK